jgi:ribonuclease P protein component
MLKVENRLKGQAEFSRVLKEGQRSRGQFLLIAFAPKATAHPRLGVMVSKKVAKKAVERNRIRRIIAHLFMHAFDETTGFDVVVSVLRLPAKTLFSTLEKDVLQWQKKSLSS